jgi:hypothetical protein
LNRWRFLIVVLAGGLANAIALYAMVSEDSALRVTTNLVDSPLALALFAVLGAAVGLGVRHRGWIAAPFAFYLGLVLLAFTPTLTDGTPLILRPSRLQVRPPSRARTASQSQDPGAASAPLPVPGSTDSA